MLFGLTNSPATFQAFMDDIYRKLILTGKLLIYMDNIFIHSETKEEHWEILRLLRTTDLSESIEVLT